MKRMPKKQQMGEQLWKLAHALNRLDEEQGTVARRNARRGVGAAVRALKMAVESAYPSLVKTKYRPITGTAIERKQEKIRRLIKRDFLPTTGGEDWRAALALRAGVRVVYLDGASYLPRWVLQIPRNTESTEFVRQVKRAKTDPAFRAALSTVNALEST